MKQCMDADNLHRRLKKIIGQVQAIDRMVDEDVPCEDILAQINAAKSALHGCGKVVLEGIGEYKGHTAYVEFQNENLTATVDGKILATTPDLISLVDTETYIPVTTDGLKYGKRVMVVGLKCFHLWRTEKGIELVGPRYFGVDTDYIPLEERCKGGN